MVLAGKTTYSSYKTELQFDCVKKVHSVSALGVLVAAIGSQCHLKGFFAGSWWWYFTQAVLVFIIHLMQGSEYTKVRFSFFFGLCFAAGVNVGSWIHVALQETGFCRYPELYEYSQDRYLGMCKPSVMNGFVLEAFMLTFGTYCAIVISTVFSKTRNMLRYGSWISAGLWVVFGTYVLHYFGFMGHEMFDAIYIKFGLALFAVKVLYDTEVTMEEAVQQGNKFDVLNHAVSAVLNFLNMFIRILKILADMKKDKQRKKK